MGRLILSRLISAIPAILLILILSFLLMRFAPGGPFDSERPLPEEIRLALMQDYGLNQPLWAQFQHYIGRILTGDFGSSLVYRDFTVNELVAQSLPISLKLGAIAIILALICGVFLAIYATVYDGGKRDKAIMVFAVLLTALPSFVTGPILALFFAVWLKILPAGGLGDSWLQWILPVIALSLPVIGSIARLARTGLSQIMAQDHIITARARGLGSYRIIMAHGLRPALIPVASYLGPAAAGLLTGAVIIETVFAIPGLGRYFVQGALNRDYPLIMAVILLYALLIIFFNLLSDILLGWLDPKAKSSEQGA